MLIYIPIVNQGNFKTLIKNGDVTVCIKTNNSIIKEVVMKKNLTIVFLVLAFLSNLLIHAQNSQSSFKAPETIPLSVDNYIFNNLSKNESVVRLREFNDHIFEIAYIKDNKTNTVYYNAEKSTIIDKNKFYDLHKDYPETQDLINSVNTTYTVTLGHFYKDAYYSGQSQAVSASFSSVGTYYTPLITGLGSLDVSSHRFPYISNDVYRVRTLEVTVVGILPDEYYHYGWYDDNYDDECLAPSGYPMWLCSIGANDRITKASVKYQVEWIVPPVLPLSASIIGPSTRSSGQTGTWTASVSGGQTPYSYQWSYYRYCDDFLLKTTSKINDVNEIEDVPCGYWFSAGTSSSVSRSDNGDFSLKLIVTDASNNSVTVTKYVTVSSSSAAVYSDKLYTNSPNPFNPSTIITYSLSEPSFVKLIIYDALGREISTLVDEYESEGMHKVRFNASDLPSGIYFYMLKSNNGSSMKKMLLTK